MHKIGWKMFDANGRFLHAYRCMYIDWFLLAVQIQKDMLQLASFAKRRMENKHKQSDIVVLVKFFLVIFIITGEKAILYYLNREISYNFYN
jgi:hypothetical protein